MTFKHFLKRATIDLSIILAVVLFAAASLMVFERYPEWKDEITKRLERQREERAAVREEQEELKGLRTLKGNIEFGPERPTLAELQTQFGGPGSKQGMVGKLVVVGWSCGVEQCPIIAFVRVSGGSVRKDLDPDSVVAELEVRVPSVADPAEFRNISIAGVHLGESAQDVASSMRRKAVRFGDDAAQLDQDWMLRWYTRNGAVSKIILANLLEVGGDSREN
jgi:hypothetical protein